jgi:hypothetical protein
VQVARNLSDELHACLQLRRPPGVEYLGGGQALLRLPAGGLLGQPADREEVTRAPRPL